MIICRRFEDDLLRIARIQSKCYRAEESIFSGTLLNIDECRVDWMTWPQCFNAFCYPDVKPKNKVNVNNYTMLLQATINNQGVDLA